MSDRTRSMSFSSEQAVVPRWFGGEILDHSPGAMRSDFLNSGRAPLLLNHDTGSQPVGVIEKGSVKCGKDKMGRCQARFGKTGAANDALTNVDDKILTNTSVGYRVHEMRYDSESNGQENYRVVDWEPHEVSLVGVPADRSVGVDRSETDEITRAASPQTMETKVPDGNTTEAAGKPAAKETQVEVVRHEQPQPTPQQMEDARVKSIRKWCAQSNIDDRIMAQFITGGMSIDKVADDILEIVKQRGDVKPQGAGALGLSENETRQFSLTKMVAATADKDWSNAGFELECSREIAKRINKPSSPTKFYVPLEVQRRRSISPRVLDAQTRNILSSPYMTRADTVGTSSKGGYLVETINLSFIELLRNRTVAFRLGATALSGLTGNVNIPKQTGAATAYWLSTETTSITEVEQTFGQLALTPQTVGAYTEVSRLLLLQSSPDIEGIVNADLAAVVGIAVDEAIINGSGSSGQPQGIIGLTGVGTGSIASTVLSTLTTIQGTVGAANVVPVSGGWAGTFTVSADLRARVEVANTYSPIWYGSVWDGVMLGYPAIASAQVPSGDLIFGDWAQVVVAEWGVLEVEVNPYANFQEGIIGIRAMMTVDVGVRYPAAFYVGTSFS